MTGPLATASNAVYIVEFDGATICVLARRSRKLRWSLSLRDLIAVEFTPARALFGGALRFRARSRSRYDRIVFNAKQEPAMQEFARIVASYQPPRPGASRPVPVFTAAEGRSIRRLLMLSIWTEGVNLALLLLPLLALVAFIAWYVLAR